MTIGFTCGKFLPFHKGHEALIRFGLAHCDHLVVLVCASDQEDIPGELRANWIQSTFHTDRRLEVKVLSYSEAILPNSSVSSEEVSEVWAKEFTKWVPEAELFFSSEPYGEFVAQFMGIESTFFDPLRVAVPISATQIRENPAASWDYLPDVVKPYFCKKVVILGTESTGKSTLTEQLATHYDVPFVTEAGRELIPDSREFEFEDLYLVAEAHAAGIDQALQKGNPLIIMDTDIHITQSYAQLFFGKKLDIQPDLYKKNAAHLYLYLRADVPLVADGTRLGEKDRHRLDVSHREVLEKYGIVFTEIYGSWEQRFQMAIDAIDRLFLPSGSKPYDTGETQV